MSAELCPLCKGPMRRTEEGFWCDGCDLGYADGPLDEAQESSTMIASNVGELIEALKTLNPSAKIYTIAPPFDGLRLVEQGDGAILFCRPKEPETKAATVARS